MVINKTIATKRTQTIHSLDIRHFSHLYTTGRRIVSNTAISMLKTASCISIFLCRIACEAYAELLEDLMIHFSKHDSGMRLTAIKFGESLKSLPAFFVMCAEN